MNTMTLTPEALARLWKQIEGCNDDEFLDLEWRVGATCGDLRSALAAYEQAVRERDEMVQRGFASDEEWAIIDSWPEYESVLLAMNEKCDTLAKSHSALTAQVERLREFVEHDRGCVLARWEAGRPTASGGYEAQYDGVWYETRPVDRTPKCDCGLDGALSPDPERGGGE